MAVRKTATKTSHRASLDYEISDKKAKRNINKTAKSVSKLGSRGILVFFICLLIGIAAGFGVYKIVCKNDCFQIIGADEITLTLDEKYEESGVKIVEFGKDISDKVKIETNLNLDENGKSKEVGTFYVKYTVDSVKFGKLFKIQKIKLITFVEASEGGE